MKGFFVYIQKNKKSSADNNKIARRKYG